MAQFVDWKEHKKKLGKELTDNVQVNVMLSPIYFAINCWILVHEFHRPLLEPFFSSAVFFSFFSTLAYMYASHYFQPDLDIHVTRPGMGHFPVGRTVGAWKLGRFLKWILWPVNRAWYYLWHPYGKLLTHRGIGHYPVLGVWLRVGYLMGALWFIKSALAPTPYGVYLYPVERWLRAFFPGSPDFLGFYFFLWCFPVYLSDFFHWLVDYYDSARKGLSFCPPKIPRGLLAKIWEGLKDLKS